MKKVGSVAFLSLNLNAAGVHMPDAGSETVLSDICSGIIDTKYEEISAAQAVRSTG